MTLLLVLGDAWGIALFDEQHPLTTWIAVAMLAPTLFILARGETTTNPEINAVRRNV